MALTSPISPKVLFSREPKFKFTKQIMADCSAPSQYLLICLHVISWWIWLYQEEIEIDATVLGYGATLSTAVVELRNKGTGEFVAQVRQSVHNTGEFNHKTRTQLNLTLFWKIFQRRSGCLPFFNYCILYWISILLCLVWFRVSFNGINPLYIFFKKGFWPLLL